MTEAEEMNAILEDVLGLHITHPTVRDYIRKGIASDFRNRQKKYRKWAKEGRADKIPDETMRKGEIEHRRRLLEIGDNVKAAFYSNMAGAVKNFEKTLEQTILGKWMVNGIALGLTTPEQLLAAALDEDERADGHAKNGKFYREIAKLGRSGEIIALSITPENAEKIRSSIFDDLEMEDAA